MTFGIYSKAQYLALGENRRFSGARVAYNLLRTGDNPGPEDIRAFEDICVTLRTSNGTFRTTYRNRFRDVDAASLRWIGQFFSAAPVIRVEDRAVSSGLTSVEWAQTLFAHFPVVEFEASDLLIELEELSSAGGETWIVEANGTPLQYIKPPFVVSLHHRESWRNPILRWVAARARRRFAQLSRADCRISRIRCIHPEAQALAKMNRNFHFEVRSVFDRSDVPCHVLRTMNILNLSYFSKEQLTAAAAVVFNSVAPGGIWIVGRTLESDLTNHVTFFQRCADRWQILDRIGNGSEIEDVALAIP